MGNLFLRRRLKDKRKAGLVKDLDLSVHENSQMKVWFDRSLYLPQKAVEVQQKS